MTEEPLQIPPEINVTWGPERENWEITMPGTIPAAEIRHAIDSYLVRHFAASRYLIDPKNPEVREIEIRARLINEGQFLGIGLLRGEGDRRTILATAKDFREGSQQARADAVNLAALRENLPVGTPLRVPAILGAVWELRVGGEQKTLPAVQMEYLQGFHEISLRATGTNTFEFVANNADPFGDDAADREDIATAELTADAVIGLARSQTLIYEALGHRIQQSLTINNGDYTTRQIDGAFLYAPITLCGDMTEELNFSEFAYRLFTHIEYGFDPATDGPQDIYVFPFAVKARETLVGMREALRYTGKTDAEITDLFQKELPGILAREDFQQFPDIMKDPIDEAIGDYLPAT
jgi:hypothetical protein